MIKRLTPYFPIIIAAMLAASTYWLQFVVSNERDKTQRGDPRTTDAYVEKLELDHYDAQGRHQFHLVADDMKHFAENDMATFTAPRLTFKREQSVMTLSAKRGQGSNVTQEITLEGNVVGTRTLAGNPVPQVLETEKMLVLAEDEIASTDVPVTMTQGQTKITGSNAEWDNVRGTLRMHQVEANLMNSGKSRPAQH